MPEIVPGYSTEQQVITVANNDTDINSAISAQAPDKWLVSYLIPSGSDVIILFTRTIAAS